MKESVIVDKSKAFALRIIKLYRYIRLSIASKWHLEKDFRLEIKQVNGLPYFIWMVLTG